MSVPNQNHIIIKKEPCNKENLYTTTNIYALQNAMQNLSGESFKLWFYFSKNQDSYSFDLSQKDAEQWGIKKTTYYRVKQELIKKGYLQPKQEGSNIYYFTEIAFSQIGKEREEIEEEKEMVISEYGKNYYQNGKDFSGNETDNSHFEQRNNTNNTDKLKDNKTKKGDKVAKNKKLYDITLSLLREIKDDLDKGIFEEQKDKKEIIYELDRFLYYNADKKTKDELHEVILSAWCKLYK